MNKKIISIGLAVIFTILGISFYNSKKASKNTSLNKNTINNEIKTKLKKDFYVKSAFADVDLDMIIEDKATKDSDKNGDYIFITFSSQIFDDKKSDNKTVLDIKNYKLDNKELPKGSAISKKFINEIIIKLPDGYLKGVNSPHKLEISKNLKDKYSNNIKGNLSLNLPYSYNKNSNSNNRTTKKTEQKNADVKNNSNNDSSNKIISNSKDIPNYSIKLGKAIPFTTIVLVELETPHPENYKITVSNTELKQKKNKEGKLVFVSAIKRELNLEDVQNSIKIEIKK
ncbi:hypothetical protein CLOACE_22790 [Clostridium acetireducens DSM 10703]|uniref:Uncharacterized protein n=1 Tax=Clostridium acetireducens DSM 10703 TaxID=1121290 RepID=A0A1E8EVM3_9CLOT|nr:hypothetical protein [Clostridium acetireducens]OFH98036.1 hypothetical protein CLOACE_22790 [Clostridium acetireducens DSM 10703]